jgi:hypothetical protein
MAVTPSYTTLEPNIVSQITGQQPSPTTALSSSFFATSTFIYTLLFVAIVAAAFYRYALAGIWRMAASEKYVRMSNDEFKRVTLGLLGVFSMFIVIYTFNKDLLKGDVGLDALKVKGQQGVPANTGGTNTGGSTALGDEAAVRAQLSGYNFKPPCTGTQVTGCANLAGINPATITMLRQLRTACVGCYLRISGGTEGGHSATSNHGIGKEAVDMDVSPGLLEFLQMRATPVGSMTGCNIRYAWGGFKFWKEPASGCGMSTGEHFHVSFSGY